MDAQEQKYIAMTQPPVGRIIGKLAVPCIISMLVTSFYNMADTFFVGMMESNAATGAVGVVFSMMAIIQAVGFFFGQGSGNYISRMMGKKNYEEAAAMAATGFFTAIAAGIVICILGQIFLEPLSYLLGSTETILPYTKAYLRIILFGAPWMTASLVLNNQLRFQGSAIYSMVGILCGAVLNIALDPILIFSCDMGVAGAGLATIISQFVSFVVLLIGCSKGSNIHISVRRVRLTGHYFLHILKGGLPSLARQSIASLATICLNHAARPYGDVVIAAMGVVQRIMQFGASAMIGFGQGFQPFCGFNYGAKLIDRVKKGFWFCVKGSFGFLCIVGALGFAFAPQLISIFRDDPEVIRCGALALRLQCISFPFQSWIVMSNMMQQVTGKTVPATFMAMARQGIFFIPCVLLLPLAFGVLGIQMAQAISDLCTVLCAIPLQFYILRSISRESEAFLSSYIVAFSHFPWYNRGNFSSGASMLKYLAVFFISMVPIVELRFAVPIAVGMDLPYLPALATCVLGNMVPVPFIYMFGRSFLKWGSRQRFIGTFCQKVLEKGEKAGEKIVATTGRGGTFVALMLFVGIPLPGTGAWTGTLAASLLNLGPKSTAISVSLGVIMAGIIMAVASGSVFHIVGL